MTVTAATIVTVLERASCRGHLIYDKCHLSSRDINDCDEEGYCEYSETWGIGDGRNVRILLLFIKRDYERGAERSKTVRGIKTKQRYSLQSPLVCHCFSNAYPACEHHLLLRLAVVKPGPQCDDDIEPDHDQTLNLKIRSRLVSDITDEFKPGVVPNWSWRQK